MASKTLLFRADGNNQIGMGHYIRSLALAQMLKNHFNCAFAIQNPIPAQKKNIETACERIIELKTSNKDEFLNFVSSQDIVVIDNYCFSTEYQRAIKSKGCKLVYIDDLNDKHYVADLIISNTIGSGVQYSKENYTKLLLGYQYALLRQPFLLAAQHIKQQKVHQQSKGRALITMGGSDPHGVIRELANQCLSHPNVSELHIISSIPPTCLQPTTKRVYSYGQQTAEQMANLMRQVDFGLLPASSLAMEATACRLPFICGWFVANQKHHYQTITQNKIAIGIGELTNLNEKLVASAISAITETGTARKLREQQQLQLDGKSQERLVQAFLNLTQNGIKI